MSTIPCTINFHSGALSNDDPSVVELTTDIQTVVPAILSHIRFLYDARVYFSNEVNYQFYHHGRIEIYHRDHLDFFCPCETSLSLDKALNFVMNKRGEQYVYTLKKYDFYSLPSPIYLDEEFKLFIRNIPSEFSNLRHPLRIQFYGMREWKYVSL